MRAARESTDGYAALITKLSQDLRKIDSATAVSGRWMSDSPLQPIRHWAAETCAQLQKSIRG